ncbi:MAG: hypothetical protein JEZ11_24720 [Desulfobacterales bacterium]|nr:hypothetical protein [Desulfobacterales bacterium]
MTSNHSSAMSQKIFDMGLPMVTVSLYLLCCGLADVGIPLTTGQIGERWNGTEAELEDGLHTLVQSGILRQVLSDQASRTGYRIMPPDHWKRD